MARKAQVTRTITTTKAIVMCLNIEHGESYTDAITLAGTYKDSDKMLKTIKKMYDTDTKKAVHIVSIDEVETLYGMDEDVFIANASVLDKDTRKPLTAE